MLENILLDEDLKGLEPSEIKALVKSLDDYIQKSKAIPPDGFNGLDAGSKKIIKRLTPYI